jgi:hypothetical protein
MTLQFVDPSQISAELFLELIETYGLGVGETECLTLCLNHSYVLCCDDNRARRVAEALIGPERLNGSLRLLRWCRDVSKDDGCRRVPTQGATGMVFRSRRLSLFEFGLTDVFDRAYTTRYPLRTSMSPELMFWMIAVARLSSQSKPAILTLCRPTLAFSSEL